MGIPSLLFEATKLPLTTWFLAIHMLTSTKTNMAALELKRHLGVSYRTAWRLKQKELGILAGLDPFVASTRINRYEQDVDKANLATAALLAKVLGVPLAYLYADNERLARMIKAFSALSAVEQDRLVKDVESQSEAK